MVTIIVYRSLFYSMHTMHCIWFWSIGEWLTSFLNWFHNPPPQIWHKLFTIISKLFRIPVNEKTFLTYFIHMKLFHNSYGSTLSSFCFKNLTKVLYRLYFGKSCSNARIFFLSFVLYGTSLVQKLISGHYDTAFPFDLCLMTPF